MSAVLVVEDEQHLLMACASIWNLRATPWNTVSDGEAALALLVDEQRRYECAGPGCDVAGKDGFTVALSCGRQISLCPS